VLNYIDQSLMSAPPQIPTLSRTQSSNYKTPTKLARVLQLSAAEVQAYGDDIRMLESELKTNTRNKDQRRITKTIDKIKRSAPAGVSDGSFYYSKTGRSGLEHKGKTLSFDDVQSDRLFKKWEKLYNKAISTVI
jgi:hypothetical protein